MRIISFTNQKGGVAKSTSTINISAILGEMGKKVLVIDIDPQGNSTIGLGINSEELKDTIYECFLGDIFLKKAILNTDCKNVDIVPSNIKLANAELEISNMISREKILYDLIKENTLDYDYILIDYPPSLGLLTINGLVATNEIIIPLDAGLFSVVGINLLLRKIKEISKKINRSLKNPNFLLTRVNTGTNLSKLIKDTLDKTFEDALFKTVIHQNIKIAEAQKEGLPISYYDRKCKGFLEYTELAKEIEKGI